MTTPQVEAAMFVGPPIHINGRQYVGASPGKPTDAAAGAQFCLWPDPVTPRNCGPPAHEQANGTLLMRQVLGVGRLGDIFWAQGYVPEEWAAASKALGFKTLTDMDPTTQQDVRRLTAVEEFDPCGPTTDGTLKCEACMGGCQLWDSFTTPFSNERTHYRMPSGGSSGIDDVILYRTGVVGQVYASTRMGTTQNDWTAPVLTDIPNDESNLNAGPLPDGRIYLVNNAVFRPKSNNAAGPETLRFRDPVTIATSTDGLVFNTVASVMSCTGFPNPNSTCSPRFKGGGKNPGPSYPQGLTVVDPAPQQAMGFYVVASNNKEDIWVTKLQYGSF